MADPTDDEGKTKLSVITADVTVAIVILLVAIALLESYFNQILNWYRGLVEWFYSLGWSRFIRVLFIIFGVLDFILLIFIISTVRRLQKTISSRTTAKITPHIVTPKEEVRENWEHIRELANSSNPSDWNMAILRADALLDEILIRVGYEGETMAERLKIVDSSKLPSLDKIWSAHHLRNMIAHDPLEQHSKETIIHALRSYEQALKELGLTESQTS
mgnify:FL=1